MPELPEVETIRRELAGKITNKKIVNFKIVKPSLIKEPSVAGFKKGLIGEKVKEVSRQAKLLIIKLREDKFLVIHLRISGWLLYGEEDPRARAVFYLSDRKVLNYMDQRVLGELRLLKDYKNLKFIKELGPEAPDVTLTKFKELLRIRKTKIKVLLLDQTAISGLGNIYAQEALFLAKIDPRRAADSLSEKEAKRLHERIVSVLGEAIKYKGSSVDTYRDLGGDRGGMEKRLKVYGRKDKTCYTCKRPLEKISLGGRGTCFCPHCQQ
ncbi:MAG: DNA-formamidopyrimidine glycosylase [Candidatus Omnitrophica bacterium]|nr:DNA-formamidopyrimidine glycosylase [Candidatus Omnitrophota bacterium]